LELLVIGARGNWKDWCCGQIWFFEVEALCVVLPATPEGGARKHCPSSGPSKQHEDHLTNGVVAFKRWHLRYVKWRWFGLRVRGWWPLIVRRSRTSPALIPNGVSRTSPSLNINNVTAAQVHLLWY